MTGFRPRLILLACAVLSSAAMAQRLVIESPAQGPTTKVIYGHLTDKGAVIFEKNFPFEMLEMASQDETTENPAEPAGSNGAADKKSPASSKAAGWTAVTSFKLSPDELSACVDHPRFRGLVSLMKILKDKVKDVIVSAGPDADACSEKVIKVLTAELKDAQVTQGNADVEGVRVELGVANGVAPAPVVVVKPVVQAARKITFESFAELIANTHIKIGDKQVLANENGYFVAEFEQAGTEVPIEIKVTDRKTISTKFYPVVVGTDAVSITNGQGYAARQATFGHEKLSITISETPFLAKKTTFDGGLGGGLGYGRQVPGEKPGQRMVAITGIERRQLYGEFGARAGLLYTRAAKTVVPQTFTFRAALFYDWALLDNDLTMRIGGGMEAFNAQIKEAENAKPGQPSVLVPQQVSAPLVSLGIHTVLFDRVIFSPVLAVTPLYIASVGFYPSINPVFEFGVKVAGDWIVMVQTGSETHRFPSALGETKLRIDFTTLTLKTGLF